MSPEALVGGEENPRVGGGVPGERGRGAGRVSAAKWDNLGGGLNIFPFILYFLWGRLLEHSFLEHSCLDQFSVFQGKFNVQRFSSTSFGRTLLGSNFVGPLARTNYFLSALCSELFAMGPVQFS